LTAGANIWGYINFILIFPKGDTALLWLSETAGVLEGPTNAVLCRHGREVLVIDPGLNRAAAERVREALAAEDLAPAALLFTHAHADHSGACHYLQKWFSVPAFGPPLEAEIASAPFLEPIYLSGGAEPLPELTEPFTLAKPAGIAGRVTGKTFRYQDFEIGVLPLPGHSPGMAGYELEEGILAAGDALILAPFRAKYPIPYLTDLAKTRASLVFDAKRCKPGFERLLHCLLSMEAKDLVGENLGITHTGQRPPIFVCGSQHLTGFIGGRHRETSLLSVPAR